MKRILFLACLVLFGSVAFAQAKLDQVVKFDATTYSFGKIKQGTPVTYEFVFSNVGKEPLIVEVATASCGCTTPEWPKQPIMPGKKGKIKVGYNAAAAGPFEKTISVKLKGVDMPAELKINGEVASN